MRPSNLRSDLNWFLVALCILLPLQIAQVANDAWFTLPPKPVGDGPDYENIGYQLLQGNGWSFDWTDPGWRAPYLKAEENKSVHPLPALIGAVGGSQEPASYYIQLSRRAGPTPTTGRPPLLPTLIAGVYCVLERGPVAFAAVRLLLASCLAMGGAIAVAMSARIASALTVRTWPVSLAAVTTLVLACLDRTLRSYATDFLTEPLALLIVQLWLWCICLLVGAFDQEPTWGTRGASPARLRALATLSGILLGLLIFARSTIVLWLPAVWLLLTWLLCLRHRTAEANGGPDDDSRADRRAGTVGGVRHALPIASRVLAVCLIVCTPWWLRNCVVLDAAMPLGTQGPVTLLGGYSDESLARWGEWRSEPEIRLRERLASDLSMESEAALVRHEVRVAQEASREVRSWIARHVGDLPKLAWMRLVNEWNPYTGRALLWKLAALLGLAFLCLRLPRAAGVLGGVLLINSLMVMAVYSVGGRFLIPTYGILYSLAGIGVMSVPLTILTRYWTSWPQAAETSAPIE